MSAVTGSEGGICPLSGKVGFGNMLRAGTSETRPNTLGILFHSICTSGISINTTTHIDSENKEGRREKKRRRRKKNERVQREMGGIVEAPLFISLSGEDEQTNIIYEGVIKEHLVSLI